MRGRSKKMKYSEIDKIRKEAKDKYYSNNYNPAEYDEDVALATAISLSLNIQNKPEESNVEEPKPVESNIEEYASVEQNVEEPIIEAPMIEVPMIEVPVVEESKEEPQDESRDEYEFPSFFTISGGMRQLDNPIFRDRRSMRKEINEEISKKEYMLRVKENEMHNRRTPFTLITENELASHRKLVKDIEDLKKKKKLEDNISPKILRLIGYSSPREVFPYMVIDETANLETNISFFIKEHPEYFVSEMNIKQTSDRFVKLMFQKR